jgi:hypothetical protein
VPVADIVQISKDLFVTPVFLFSVKSAVTAPSKAPAPVPSQIAEESAKPAAQKVTPWDVQGEISADGKALEM